MLFRVDFYDAMLLANDDSFLMDAIRNLGNYFFTHIDDFLAAAVVII
jgi:hypothetical protein